MISIEHGFHSKVSSLEESHVTCQTLHLPCDISASTRNYKQHSKLCTKSCLLKCGGKQLLMWTTLAKVGKVNNKYQIY